MTGKADFTPEEWELVREGPPTAALVAMTAEKGGSYKTPEELDAQGLGRLTEAVALLAQKATAAEVDSYRKFALDVAQRVAEAHKEGGQPVSDAERAAIERVKAILYPPGSE